MYRPAQPIRAPESLATLDGPSSLQASPCLPVSLTLEKYTAELRIRSETQIRDFKEQKEVLPKQLYFKS